MAKNKKKRNKTYRRQNAAVPSTPVVHRYEAVERSRPRQWVTDHKLRIRIIGILAAIAGGIFLIVSAFISVLQ